MHWSYVFLAPTQQYDLAINTPNFDTPVLLYVILCYIDYCHF